MLNEVYAELIRRLPLYEDHGKSLVARGFTLEEVHRLGYRSFPIGNDSQRVVDELETAYAEKLLTVPGFDRQHRDGTLTDGTCTVFTSIRLSGDSGILLPQRDAEGRIVGMMLRLDPPKVLDPNRNPRRYLPLTSYTSSGCAAKIDVHVPLHGAGEGRKPERLIEGIIKADLVTLRTGLVTLGIPSGGRWLQGLRKAEALGAEHILFTPDADTQKNAGICSSLTKAADTLAAKGAPFGIETWAPEAGKGLDDVIADGKQGTVVVSGGVAAWNLLKVWLASSGAPIDPHVIARVTLDHVVERTQADPSYPFTPNIAEAIALLDEGTVETQRLLAALRKSLKGAWKDFDRKLKEARQKKRRLVRAGECREAEAYGPEVVANEYADVSGATCLVVRDSNAGVLYNRVSNFTAKIEREVTQDDGVTSAKLFTVSGKLSSGTPLPTVEIPASSWTDRSWLAERWGSRPVVEAGRDSWGHLLAAIQTCSSPTTSTTYTHTGWRNLDGRWVYLMSGGSIGCADADVKNPDDGGRYGFPAQDGAKDHVVTCVRRSLQLLTMDAKVSVLAAAAVYTAPLCSALGVDFAVWLAGESGGCKSGLAGLMMCHFGTFSYSSLPISWTSTVNAIEALLFRCKDVLVVVDNYVPGEKEGPAKVNRLVHQVGDRAGRGRLSKNSDAMPARPPRGMMFATGEDTPIGTSDSTVGRILIGRMVKDDAFRAKVIAASSDPEDYATAMRAYLEWFAPEYEKHAAAARDQRDHLLPQIEARLRDSGVHPRTSRSVATLGAGVTMFLSFAQDIGAITAIEHEDLQRHVDRALVAVAQDQGGYRENAKPHERYLSALRAMLAQGLVTISPRYEDLDKERGIGWEGDGEFIYLHPDLAWRAVESFHAQGAKWPYSKTGMHQSLVEAGVVHRGESGRADTKRSVGVGRQSVRVLLLHREQLAEALPARVHYGEFSVEAEDVAAALPN